MIRDILTTKNGHDFCFARTTGLLGVLAAIFFSSITAYHGHEVKIQDFCIGIATIIGSACAGAKIKESTEPN